MLPLGSGCEEGVSVGLSEGGREGARECEREGVRKLASVHRREGGRE